MRISWTYLSGQTEYRKFLRTTTIKTCAKTVPHSPIRGRTRFLLRFGTARFPVWLSNVLALFLGSAAFLLGTLAINLATGGAVQALAEGKPVVAYHLDGTPEVVISGKTGFTVEPQNIQEATDALLHLLKNPSEAAEMGARGRELVREKFPWQTMSDILIREYETFLAGKRSQ